MRIFDGLKNFSVHEDRFEVLLRIFYISFLNVSFFSAQKIFSIASAPPGFAWIETIFGLNGFFYFLAILFGGTYLSWALCAVFPKSRPLKFLAAWTLFVLLGLKTSSYQENHSLYGYLFCSILFATLGTNPTQGALQRQVQTKFMLWAAQMSLMSTYLFSGLWKLRTLPAQILEIGWQNWDPLRYHIASAHLEYFSFSEAHTWLAILPSWLSRLMWFAVILAELMCILVPWLPSVQRYWGFLLFIFQFSVAVTMDVHFHASSQLALVLLTCHPYVSFRGKSQF